MHLVYKKRTNGQIEFGIVYGGIALLALCAARFLPVLAFLPSCPIHDLTGLPCPTCGSSRSIVYLAQGNILSSLTINPLAALCVIAAILYFLYSLVAFTLGIPENKHSEYRERKKHHKNMCVFPHFGKLALPWRSPLIFHMS